jgi:hypothetical protein
MNKMTTLDKVIGTVMMLVFIILLYTILVWLPVNLRDHSTCLDLGYPEVHTTLTLDSYCISISEVTKL